MSNTAPNGEYASDATTLGESTEMMEQEGFEGQFAAADGGQIMCFTCRELSDANTVEMVELRRTEGASDPDDMTAIAAFTCPQCGTKGTLVVHYGAEATPEEQDVLRLLEDARTK